MFPKLMLRLAAVLLTLLALPAAAALNVFATVPEWAALAKEIGLGTKGRGGGRKRKVKA